MRVDSSNRYSGITDVSARANAKSAGAQQDAVSVGDTQFLQRSLQNQSDVRADKVAAAKALVADNSYPQDAVLGRVADILSKNLKVEQAE